MKRPTYENAFYVLALLLALGVRFYNLGAAPLSDAEASYALQALQTAQPGFDSGPSLNASPAPAYTILTGLSLSLLGSSNFVARFWPALCGSLLVLLPLFFRRELGKEAALIMAFGLAIDPGLVTIARTAGGVSMALGFGLLAAGLWHLKRPAPAGLFGGLALLSGAGAFQGTVILSLGLVVVGYARRAGAKPPASDPEKGEFSPGDAPEIPQPRQDAYVRQALRGTLLAAILTILAAGTLFFLRPQGLAAWIGSLLAYFDGWRFSSGVPVARILAALLVYQPFAILFAVLGVVRWLVRTAKTEGEENPLVEAQDAESGAPGMQPILLPLLWAVFALALALIYPGRQVSDLVWVLPPFWALAALELARYIPLRRPHPMAIVHACLLFVLAGLLWNMLLAPNTLLVTNLPWALVRGLLVLAVLILGALTSILVALGWSSETSRLGLVWGLTGVFIVYLASAMWGSAHLRQNQPPELWATPPGTLQAGLLQDTLHQLAEWSGKLPPSLEVTSTVSAPSMRWVLRDFAQTKFVVELPSGSLPAVIITAQGQEAPALTTSYRGQDFTWWSYPAWSTTLPQDILTWLTLRKAPLFEEQVILWARSDLFPGGGTDTSAQP